MCIATWFVVIVFLALKLKERNTFALFGAAGNILTVLFYVVQYNRIMAHVEQNGYSPTTKNSNKQKNDKNNG